MQTAPIAFATPPDGPSWQRWLVFSAAARIVFFAAMLFAVGSIIHIALGLFGWAPKAASPLKLALVTLSLQLLPALIAYLALVKLIERRRMREFVMATLPTFGITGLATGAALFSIVVGVLWLCGAYHVIGINQTVNWLPQLLVAGMGASIGEEIVMRGVLFRIIEEGCGTWIAVAVSALFSAARIFSIRAPRCGVQRPLPSRRA